MSFERAHRIMFLSLLVLILFNACEGGSSSRNSNQENPKPAINSISPENCNRGDSGFTLTVHGSDFLPSSIVRWNGYGRDTTFISSTQLSAAVNKEDVANSGTARITVFNPSPGGGTSNSKAFMIYLYPNDWTFLGVPTVNGTEYYDVGQIIVDPEDQLTLYVMVYGEGLFTSRDGGESWELAVSAESPSYGFVAQDPDNLHRLFYGQHNKLYVSNDRGMTWNLNHTFNAESYIETITFSNFYPDTIYVGPRGSNVMFHRSTDDGESWQSYSYGQTTGMDNFIPWAVAEDPVDGTLFAGVELGNHPQPYRPPFLRSADGGVTWENLVEGMNSSNEGPIWHVTSIVVNPNNHKVYALSEGAGLYTSMDHGETWSRTPDGALVGTLIRDPWREGWLFASSIYYQTLEGGVYVTTDDGENFYPFGLQGHTTADLSLTGDGRYLYVAAYQSGIYYTRLP